MTIGMIKIETLCGIPTPEMLTDVASILIGPFLELKPRISDGPALSKMTGIDPLKAFLRDRPNFSAAGAKHFELLFSWNSISTVRPIQAGYLAMFMDLSNDTRDTMLDSLVAAMRLLRSPFGFLDFTGVGTRTVFGSRGDAHREIYQRGRSGRDRMFNLSSGGMSGIAWHTVLGPDLVRFFGEAALASLAPELARNLGDGLWLLTPCERFEDWTANTWCKGEAAIISALGVDRFFDPSTSRLPDRFPSLPEFAPYAVKVERTIDDGEHWHWEFRNGYPPPE